MGWNFFNLVVKLEAIGSYEKCEGESIKDNGNLAEGPISIAEREEELKQEMKKACVSGNKSKYNFTELKKESFKAQNIFFLIVSL